VASSDWQPVIFPAQHGAGASIVMPALHVSLSAHGMRLGQHTAGVSVGRISNGAAFPTG